MRLATLVVIALATTAVQLPLTKPAVTPIFTDGPARGAVAFVVQCHNATAVPIRFDGPPTAQVWVDGRLYQPSGYAHMGIASAPVPPGASWKQAVVLHPASTSGATFKGAWVQTDITYPLAAGGHTVAFACGGARSDDVPFYWQAVSD